MTGPATYNFADVWESVAARVPERTAIVCGDLTRTFAGLDARADRLAGWMESAGVGPDDFVGLALRNGPAYVEATLAAHKLRAVPVNVNYRLQVDELRHLVLDGPLVGVVHEPELTERLVSATAGAAWLLPAGDPYEDAVSSSPPAPRRTRSGDDLYVLYTGGTTGSPKGVVWRMSDAFFACVGGGDPRGDLGPVSRPGELPGRIGPPIGFLPAAPLVHAAGMWTTLRWLFAGSKVVLLPGFEPSAVWAAITAEQVSVMNIVGDAMARPLLATAPASDSSLRVLGSGGATLSAEVKAGLLERLPELTIKDTFGSSETGVQGWSVHRRGDSTTARFHTVATVVLDPDTLSPLPPGSPVPGIVARRGRVPLRYHGDPERSADTFRVIGSERHALTGDLGRVEPDGTVSVLGRGSQCINTGGEKVFAEEVEQVLLSCPGVTDAVVVGVPDDRWGQAVTAVVSTETGSDSGITAERLRGHCRQRLAGYKVPKRIVATAEVRRTPAGKPDYGWATALAAASTASTASVGAAPEPAGASG